jgi:hypothetical protein
MVEDNRTQLVHELQALLNKQIELARDSSAGRVVALSDRAESLAQEIAQAGFLQLPEFKEQRERLQESYAGLSLALAVQKAETAENLSLVRKVKRTVATYGDNI